MSTTLEQELLQAAERAEARAIYWQSLGLEFAESRVSDAEATHLRARAAWVAALVRQVSDYEEHDVIRHYVLVLTSPIPAAETAPAGRKEP